LAWWKANQERISDIISYRHWSLCNPWHVSWSRKNFQWVCTSFSRVQSCRIKQTIMDRRNRLGTDSVECIECLHHWLGSGIVAGVLTAMNIDGWIDCYWWLKEGCRFFRVDDMTTFGDNFILNFHVFVDLSLVVCSIAIKNIKNRWITLEIDEVWGGFIDWKNRGFGQHQLWREKAVMWCGSCCIWEWTDQSGIEKISLWLKIMALIGHHEKMGLLSRFSPRIIEYSSTNRDFKYSLFG
jgi:hypothetical protein